MLYLKVLKGVRTCSPFEEGILCAWVGCPPSALQGKGAVSKIARGEVPVHDATVMMSPFWKCPIRWLHEGGGGRVVAESVIPVPLLTTAATAPVASTPPPALTGFTLQSSLDDEVWSLHSI